MAVTKRSWFQHDGAGGVTLGEGYGPVDITADPTILRLDPNVVLKGDTKTLVDATWTSIFELPMVAGGMAGGFVRFAIRADDATDFQVLAGTLAFAGVRKAAVYTVNPPDPGLAADDEKGAPSAGTLTALWRLNTGGDKITMQVKADSSLAGVSIEIHYVVGGLTDLEVTIL